MPILRRATTSRKPSFSHKVPVGHRKKKMHKHYQKQRGEEIKPMTSRMLCYCSPWAEWQLVENLSNISIASLHSKCCISELSLRVGLMRAA